MSPAQLAELKARLAAGGAPDGLVPVQDPSVAAAAAAQGAGAPATDPQRLQAFQKANFDRRSSTILAQWSQPEPTPVDQDEELALPEPLGAAPTPPAAPAPLPAPQPGPAPEDPAEREAWEAAAAAATRAWEEQNAAAQAAFAEAQTAFAAVMQDFQKRQSEFNQKQAQAQAKRLAREVEIYTRHVTLGRWPAVAEILATFDEAPREQLYTQLLQKLGNPPAEGGNNQLKPFAEKNAFTFGDILGLIEVAPTKLEKKHHAFLVPLIARCFETGHNFDDWLGVLRTEVARPEGERRLNRRQAAQLLTAQGRNDALGEFLPSLAQAQAAGDREALNLLARFYLASHRKAPLEGHLEKAWEATLAALAPGEIPPAQKTEALKRAVELAPQVREANGASWLDESFSTRPERGMEILATIGTEASKGMTQRANDTAQRLETLRLLQTAVTTLLTANSERADEWREPLNLLADVWLREARHAYQYSQADQMGPIAERDPFGNIYWRNYGGNYRSTPVQPLEPGDLLELRPDGRWRDMLADSVRAKFDSTTAELYLKVNEEAMAFPYIQALAKTDLDTANALAREFLNVWIRNHDPNSSRNRMNVYNFQYGYNTRAAGIPLTRSKQERNLRDLAEWIERLRGVEGIELDSRLLVRAFTSSHSAAEIYRIETLEAVFGTLEDLDASTLAAMAQTMRANLAQLWRQPAVQAAAGTNRKQKDIEAEVQKGYALAQAVLGRALQVHPDAWELKIARAAMIHDLNNYRNELQKSSDFAATRKEALNLFAAAAADYVGATEQLESNKQTTEAFEAWFYAALGASDIAAVDQSTVLARAEIPKIKAALDGIPGETGERHRGMFANSMFSRLSAVNPAVKNRYLEAGFEIVGDHPQAQAARKVYDYYNDLVTEIQVLAAVDGDSDVGTEPFGVKVEVRYTKEIERESGGFAKYLQNQANNVNAYYNYGRPQENYRDKFEESVRTTLGDQFEVMSVTFNKEDASSKADAEFGWRRMNYAYLLLKAKGPQVDRLPPLKLDLDFNDVTGYVVLPVSSPVVPIDASAEGDQRPYRNLEITQILDERKAKDGILGLEIKAQAEGLVPDLEDIVELAPGDFEVDEISDQEVAVSRFADDEEGVVTERLWVVTMKVKPGVEQATRFRFGTPRDADAQVVYQRYDDADLMTASAEIELLGEYEETSSWSWWWLALPIALIALIVWLVRRAGSGETQTADAGIRVPERLTPFSVIGLLQQIQASPRLADGQRAELSTTILRIEQHYFGEKAGDAPDLGQIAQDWVRRA